MKTIYFAYFVLLTSIATLGQKKDTDYEAGTKIIATENFEQDALADFPVNWLTNSGGEVTKIKKENWLMLNADGVFTATNFDKLLPKNCTLEFDVLVSDDYSFYSTSLGVNFIPVKNLKKEYQKLDNSALGVDEGIQITVHPQDAGSASNAGTTEIKVITDSEAILKNDKAQKIFTNNHHRARIQFWRQNTRLRVYINGKKIWDLPQVFQNQKYNAITFSTGSYKDEDKLYITNLVLAEAGADTRHKLITTGTFTTNDILFDINKATIKTESETILNEIGRALETAPDFKVEIVGHTDNVGDAKANQTLSEKRAASVKEYLVSHFEIDRKRIVTSGKGATEPLAENKTENGRKQNRRVAFIKI
ncbi:OmpA family protein [Flavobacterium sp.]|uniref:OmpA family protein n=1 Tax=Flavobacterium sp. TaxID=239 RepID=UPI00262DB9CD|nr:OmpA family protein [Flavobacterium sp.]